MMQRVGLPVLMCLLGLTVGVLPSQSADAASGRTTVTTRTTSTTMSAAEFEARLLARTNARRERRGCRPIRLHAALVLAARAHSSRMSSAGELSHRLAGEAGLSARVEQAGYTSWRLLAENLAWGYSTPRGVFRGWLRSSGHRANLDNCRLRDIGFGVVIRNGHPWVTADFGRRA